MTPPSVTAPQVPRTDRPPAGIPAGSPVDPPTPPPSDPPTPPPSDLARAPVGGDPVLEVTAWDDPVLDPHGMDVRSGYVERFWLPVLGPSAVLALRLLADRLDGSPKGVVVDLEATARSLGVGGAASRHTPLRRALQRCIRFGMARPLGPATLEVRRSVGLLPQRHLLRLPIDLQEEHRRWALPPDPGTLPLARRRARLLALDLLDTNGEPDLVERRLVRWGIHPALASEAAAWARLRMAEAALAVVARGQPSAAAAGSQLASSSSRVRTPNPVAPLLR